MFILCVIQSRRGLRYPGFTSDINRRLEVYNSGLCKTTKPDSDWQLTYREEYTTRSEAMMRERFLKSGKGRSLLDDLIAWWSPPQAE